MGEMAEYNIDEGMDLLIDHKLGHPNYDGPCPFCEDEEDGS